MGIFTLPNILVISSGVSLLIAISLTGGSLSKSVKWNLYDSQTDYGYGYIVEYYAYQNLWTSYDGSTYDKTKYPLDTYVKPKFREESWRDVTRYLVLASIGSSGLSFINLVLSAMIPIFRRKLVLLYTSRGLSSFLALSAGSMLSYALSNYIKNYPSLHSVKYYDPDAMYPREDNVSTGFYMGAVSSALVFASAILNIVNIIVIQKRSRIFPHKTASEQ